MQKTEWWEITLPFLARVVLFFGIVFLVAMCGCAEAPTRVGRNSGCDIALSLDAYGLPGWAAYECPRPFAAANWHEPRPACGAERPSTWKGPGHLDCGFVPAVTDCAHKEIRTWWYAPAGSFEHELEHARKDCR